MDLIKPQLGDDEIFLNIPKPFLILCGLWDENLFQSARKQIVYHYYILILQSLYLSWFLLMLVDFILAVRNDEWTSSSGAIIITYCEMMTKFIIFRRNKVPQFFGHVKHYEQKIKSLNNSRIIKSYKEQASISNKINCCSIIITIIVTSSFVIGGIIDDIESKKFGKDENYRPYKKMYPIWLPFNVRDMEPLILVINLLIAASGVALYNSILMTLVTMSEFLAAQLKVLRIKFSDMTTNRSNRNMNQYLKELIVEHKYIIRLTKAFSHSVRYITLMEYLLNSIAVAAVAIQLLSLKNHEDYMYLASFACTLYIHIFSLGWSANEVKVQSVNVADGINEMDWYDEDADFKRMIHMVMLRAQEPLIIEMGPFAAMTIDSALMSMKAAYSYLMVMKSF
ncbi:odorant receptor 10-like [Rhynchophorus ferrugineus]|uniref:Odorant receptor n=1 Tax=Rhynchophorus ferrugineus TaxID=354439 RepID=A0A834MA58_RHYFE|nr:hypothetical protein GWI33_015007 [Rhynchophorus ferrugineus]